MAFKGRRGEGEIREDVITTHKLWKFSYDIGFSRN